MLAMPSITALVPVYNEIATVSNSVRKIHDFMRSLACTFEILIIESGSSDGTAEACDLLASQLSEVVVVHEGRRNGFGAALRLGFAKATNDLIWVVPVDLPYSLSLLREGLRQIDDCDAVLSVRRSDDRSLVSPAAIPYLHLALHSAPAPTRVFAECGVQTLSSLGATGSSVEIEWMVY